MTLAGQSKLHGHRPATLVRLVCGHNEENHDAVAQATLARGLSPGAWAERWTSGQSIDECAGPLKMGLKRLQTHLKLWRERMGTLEP